MNTAVVQPSMSVKSQCLILRTHRVAPDDEFLLADMLKAASEHICVVVHLNLPSPSFSGSSSVAKSLEANKSTPSKKASGNCGSSLTKDMIMRQTKDVCLDPRGGRDRSTPSLRDEEWAWSPSPLLDSNQEAAKTKFAPFSSSAMTSVSPTVVMPSVETKLELEPIVIDNMSQFNSLSSQETSKVYLHWKHLCEKVGALLTVSYESEIKRKYSSYRGAWYHSYHTFVETWLEIQRLLKQHHRDYNARLLASSSVNPQQTFSFSGPADFDFYWFVEYDARFVGEWSSLIHSHDRYSYDLMGTHVAQFSGENCGWEAWRIPGEHWTIDLPHRWKFFGAVTRVTSRLMQALEQERSVTHATFETYVPSICVKHCGADSVGNLEDRFWNAESVRYTPPHGNVKEYESKLKYQAVWFNKILHPIKEKSVIPDKELSRQQEEAKWALQQPRSKAVKNYRQHHLSILEDLLRSSIQCQKKLGQDYEHIKNLVLLSDDELFRLHTASFEQRLKQLSTFEANT